MLHVFACKNSFSQAMNILFLLSLGDSRRYRIFLHATTTSKFSACAEIQAPSCGTRAAAFEMLVDAAALKQSSKGAICPRASFE